jgi:hypothetical protein
MMLLGIMTCCVFRGLWNPIFTGWPEASPCLLEGEEAARGVEVGSARGLVEEAPVQVRGED